MDKGVKRKLCWIAISGLILLGASVYHLLREEPAPLPARPVLPSLDAHRAGGDMPGAGEAERVERPDEALPGAPGVSGPAAGRSYPRPARAIDPEARKKMLAALISRWGKKAAAGERAQGEQGQPAREGKLSADYIRASMREITPLIKECFQMALAESPGLEGRITLRFDIIADEQYGGLVESSEVRDDSELARNPVLNECLRETIYALKIKAPEGGGRVTVNYPFLLKTAPSEAEKRDTPPSSSQ